ncbi:MAG: hypothetical protein JSU57_05355 [Candidatus Heimdallarchaeota archaeon]|nr:MAG: hypothetical protein JSU57_05355 [Candidatus Heimdallarchaeota archaeon]
MSEFGLQDEFSLRISVLSHPDGYASQLIKSLVEKYSNQSTHENISVISANISTIKLFILNNPVKIILIQPVSQLFTNKLHTRFYKSLAALILFSDHDSEVAAKVFYQIYRKTVGTTNPVAFVEIINDSDQKLLIDDPEILEKAPHEAYYSLKGNDVNSFQRILESLVNQCYKKEH